jgi:hypothetical protein
VVTNLLTSTNDYMIRPILCYRFLNYNVDWIQGTLGVQSGVQQSGQSDDAIPALIKPWSSEMFPPQSPFDMMNHIGGSFSCNHQPSNVIDDNGNTNTNTNTNTNVVINPSVLPPLIKPLDNHLVAAAVKPVDNCLKSSIGEGVHAPICIYFYVF